MRSFKLFLATFVMVLSMFYVSAVAKANTGVLSNVKLYLDGGRQNNGSRDKTVQAYNVDGFNYFRARDIFSALNLSIEPVTTGNGVAVNSRKPYVSNTTLPSATSKNINVNLFTTPLYYDGVLFQVTCFNLDGYNYFKLQDLSVSSFQSVSTTINEVEQSVYTNTQVPDLTPVVSFSLDYNQQSNTIIINNSSYELNNYYNEAKKIATTNIPTDKSFNFSYYDYNKGADIPIIFKNQPYLNGKNFMVPFEDIAKATNAQFKVSGNQYYAKQVMSSKSIADMYSTIDATTNELKIVYTGHSGYKTSVSIDFDIKVEIKNGQLFVPLEMATLATETMATVDVNNYTVKINYSGLGIGSEPGARTVKFVAEQKTNTTEQPSNPTDQKQDTVQQTQNPTNNQQTQTSPLADVVVKVGNKAVKLGDTEQYVTHTFGTPDRKDSMQDYTWYVYNSDYSKFIMIAIKDNKVIGYATNAKDFTVNNGLISEGSQTNEELSKNMNIIVDRLDGNKVRGIYYCETQLDSKNTTNNNFKAQEYINFDFVNGFRATMGKAPLAFSEDLASVARAHSQDMANKGCFNHTNQEGLNPFDRMKNAGIDFYSAGENIASTYLPNGVSAFEMWLNSDGHRKNMLSDDFTEIGVGMGYNGGNFMYTQVFKG